jgi:hypothetical protein
MSARTNDLRVLHSTPPEHEWWLVVCPVLHGLGWARTEQADSLPALVCGEFPAGMFPANPRFAMRPAAWETIGVGYVQVGGKGG